MKTSKPCLVDTYDRHLNYLRISITDRCNLNCLYCMPRVPVPKLRHDQILRYEEILRVVRIAVGLGIRKVRLTGGEPLVRNNVISFIKRLTKIPTVALAMAWSPINAAPKASRLMRKWH